MFFILGILLAAIILWAAMALRKGGGHETIRITVDGKEYGTYSLSEDQVISIGDTNICEIKDKKVKMIQADCPDHLCMKQKAIGEAGGTIVCLPNKVVIEGGKTANASQDALDIDAVT